MSFVQPLSVYWVTATTQVADARIHHDVILPSDGVQFSNVRALAS